MMLYWTRKLVIRRLASGDSPVLKQVVVVLYVRVHLNDRKCTSNLLFSVL